MDDVHDADQDATPDELREAITNLNTWVRRIPAHYVDRRAIAHERINQLLDQLDEVT